MRENSEPCFIMPPNLLSLRRGDGPAWAEAYSLLWETGMMIARLRLAGERFAQDRQDIVSTAIQQLIRGLVEEKNESYNQITTWDDCLGMTRHILRQRIKDFLRSRERSFVDAVEELPEAPLDFAPDQRFRLEELLPEVDRLQPDPPVPQVFRDRFIEGWSTDEIVERRGINRNTLLTYFAKGLRTLRERLTRLEGDLS